jgi:hypothetical protein
MTGSGTHTTVADVRASWEQWAAQNGFQAQLRGEPGDRVNELRELDDEVPARVEHGRWLADCPAIDCHGAAAAWPKNPHACCLDCGTVFPVKFPTSGTISKAELVLAARPLENQGWNPGDDETVADLKAENVTRGYLPQVDDFSPSSRAKREQSIRAAAAAGPTPAIELPKTGRL